jgi:hypothetical protein
LHDEAAIHIGFADGERRVENELPFGRAIGDTGNNGRATSVAEVVGATVGVDQAQRSCCNNPIEGMPERTEHRTSANPQRERVFSSLHRHFTSMTPIKQQACFSAP